MATPTELILRYRKGSGEWQEIKLTGNITIGRAVECNLIIIGTGVSRQHATISVREDGIWLSDLGSSNGTYMGDDRLTPQTSYPFLPGSTFRISEFTFEIREDITEPEAIPGQKNAENVLLYRLGTESWKKFPFRGSITIGRGIDCDLTLNDSKVSRQHVKLEEKAGGFWLTDLGSSNGTRIENQKIPANQPQNILPGKLFTLGNMFFSLEGKGTRPEVSEPIFVLWYKVENGPWKDYHIVKNMVIGRSSECDLVIDDAKASRRHVQLEINANNIVLKDLGSRNGTRVAGRTIQPNTSIMLMPGQIFQIGGMTFTTALPGESQPVKVTGAVPQAIPGVQPVKVPAYPQPLAGVPPRLPAYPPMAKKSSPWGWIAGIMGVAVVLACICVAGISAIFIFMQEPEVDREVAASQTAWGKTKVAMVTPGDNLTPVSPQDDTPEPDVEVSNTPEGEDIPTDIPTETLEPVPQEDTWLIMLYNDADDQILERDLIFDVNEAEKAGSSDRVKIVLQLDRHGGAYTGDGDWATTRRFFLNQDGDLQAIYSPVVEDMNEVNMSEPNSLADFMVWAIGAYPANKHVLIMSDHGSGWPGGYSDQDNGDDGMLMFEINQVLDYVTRQTGIDKLELMGFDACLMSQLEVLSMIEPYARYAVVSEEIEPSVGWAYTAFLTQLLENPDMGGDGLATAIVNTYLDQDQRYVDAESRREFLAERDITTDYTPAEIAQALWEESTLSGIDMSHIPDVNEALNNLALAMQGIDQSVVAQARTYAQGYTSAFGEDVPPSYLDLLHFANLVASESGNTQVQDAVDQLNQAIGQAVIIERHGPARPGSTGITFYFPNSQLYEATYDNAYGYQYTMHVNQFAVISLWDEFLDYHYTGKSFNK